MVIFGLLACTLHVCVAVVHALRVSPAQPFMRRPVCADVLCSLCDVICLGRAICLGHAVCLVGQSQGEPRRPPSTSAAVPRSTASTWSSTKELARNPQFCLLAISYAVQLGAYSGWSGVLTPILVRGALGQGCCKGWGWRP